ncbi:MAG TPA: MarR family transcriptional regulator [Mycobacteriales bacterium]|jgi:DNA-binding MarR family transcriptional regulator|nr:MarR family transcriptional regulator [Mycobacteriales bacterium]
MPRHTAPAASTDVVEAVLLASRVLVAVAAQSLAEVADRVTLPQYRTLVVLATRGPMSLGALAEELAIHPSTATRQCDRLVAATLIRRTESRPDRRAVTLQLTPDGQRVVEEVTARRRTAITEILANMTDRQRSGLVSALHSFAEAAGEIPPEQAWSLGWNS